jgi:uncharacterized protein (TIGR02147 family)
LRAFSRSLGISPGLLSLYLSRARPITLKTGTIIAGKMGLEPDNREAFLRAVRSAKPGKQGPKRLYHQARQLEQEEFELISDPLHLAIHSLIRTDDFRMDPHWIARRLDCSVIEVRNALDRLARLHLIELGPKRVAVKEVNFRTPTDRLSSAIQKHHTASLERTLKDMSDVDVKARDLSATTMAIDPKRLKEAKELIKQFRWKLMELMESGRKKEVYQLQVSFMPITKRWERDGKN